MSALNVLKLLLEIMTLAWIAYYFYSVIRSTRAVGMIRAMAVAFSIYAIAVFFELEVLRTLFEWMFVPLTCLLLLIYQPELRRAFATEQKNPSFFRKKIQTSGDQIDSILSACKVLASERRGALIVFPRQISLKSIIDTGTKINADLSSTLILTVFDHDTPLHDGAMIISEGRIVACGCYLPLSDQRDIKKTFGTRHRAALGMAEESDAIVLVVSEEKSTISLAYNSDLYYDLETDTIKRTLLSLFNYQSNAPEVFGEVNSENE
ncbi:MAG: diadenylate cyclase CdaA [Sphaerochaetaceae bacterium]